MLACARVLGPGVSYAEPSIGRVATRRDRRSEGLGKELMERSIEVCRTHLARARHPDFSPVLSGSRYGELGFAPVGEPYLEDGIPHIQMLRSARV